MTDIASHHSRLWKRGRLMIWFRRRRRHWPDISVDEVRKRARVLVVDDVEFFYLALLKRDGYQVEQWSDVMELQKLEANYYDVILLDIQGVGRQLSADEGLGILRHLKRVAPAQIIVAYSNADWPLKYKEFFDLADATLDKRSDYVDFKRTLDEMLARRFSLAFYLDRILALAPAGDVDKEKLRKAAEKSILKKNPRLIEEVLEDAKVNHEIIGSITQVTQTAIGILQLLAAL